MIERFHGHIPNWFPNNDISSLGNELFFLLFGKTNMAALKTVYYVSKPLYDCYTKCVRCYRQPVEKKAPRMKTITF